jgi:hypothetical protein
LLNLTAAVRVAVIDVARPLADLDCGRAGQPPCTAAWILVRQAAKSINRADDYPPGLARAEFRGMTAGPLAYLRARWARSPWRR